MRMSDVMTDSVSDLLLSIDLLLKSGNILAQQMSRYPKAKDYGSKRKFHHHSDACTALESENSECRSCRTSPFSLNSSFLLFASFQVPRGEEKVHLSIIDRTK